MKAPGNPQAIRRTSAEHIVEVCDVSGHKRTLRAGMQATIQTVKYGLAAEWRIPVICQKLLLTQSSDGVPRLLSDHERIADLQREGGMEQLQLLLIASMEDLLEQLGQEFEAARRLRNRFMSAESSTRVKLFRELLCAAEWTQQGEDRIVEHVHSLSKSVDSSERRVALLALARWSWKGDMTAHIEFIRYVEQYLPPLHFEQLQSLQLELRVESARDVESPENPEVSQLMAAAITMGASQLDNTIGFYYWADIIAQMVPQGDLRAVCMLCGALQQRRPSIRRIAAVALRRLPWWNLRCTLTALPRLAQGMIHKNGSVRHAALHALTSVVARGWWKGLDALSDKDMAVVQASLAPVVSCLTDAMPKIRYAAWAFLPHLRTINMLIPSQTCNNLSSTSVDGKAVSAVSSFSMDGQRNMLSGSNLTPATAQQQSRSRNGDLEGKASPCSKDSCILRDDGSLSWCDEYYAIKADRRRAITRSRLHLGKQLQWRSNKHHRNSAANPHRKTSTTKPRRRGGRHHKVSLRAFAETATASMPRRAPAFELICPVDLYWALHGKDPLQRDHDDANSCGKYSSYCDYCCGCPYCLGYDPCDPLVDPFAEEYDWWKEARSAKIARSRIGKRSELRRCPKMSFRDLSTKRSHRIIKTLKKTDRVVLASNETTPMSLQRLPRKATCENVHWQEVLSLMNAKADPDAQDQLEAFSQHADAHDKLCGASSVTFGCWLDVHLSWLNVRLI